MFEIAELSLTYSQYQERFKRKIHFIYTNMITMTCLFGKPIYIFLSTLSIDYLSTRLSTLRTIAIPNKTTCISVETVFTGQYSEHECDAAYLQLYSSLYLWLQVPRHRSACW